MQQLFGTFTKPFGASYRFGWQNGTFVEDDESGPYSESSLKREGVEKAGARERDSHRGPAVMLKPTPYFERWGRRFVRLFAVDNLATLLESR